MALKNLLDRLTGSFSQFSLEIRIFHAFSLVAIVTLLYCVPLNVALGLPVSALLAFCAAFIQSLLFYISRYKGLSRLSLALSIIIIHLILVINFHYNSGIGGPTLLLLITVLFLVASATKGAAHWYWIGLNVLVVVGLISLEYYSPHLVRNLYTDRSMQYADLITAYFLSGITILVGLHYLKRNYYKSQELLESRAADLVRINETKTKIFSIISHDLRAPIASIQSYLELLTYAELPLEERMRIKSELIELTQNTDFMLSNLLTWSKSQMDGINPEPREYKLIEILEPVLQVENTIATRKGVSFHYEISYGHTVMVDKHMLQLVTRNIISNAIKFTHPTGTVSVEARHVGSHCEIIIKDTGTGMNENIRDSVFSLNTSSSYGTKNEKGVGLGLSLSKEFIEIQGGHIAFETEEGSGTTFFIRVPADVSD